ncbi:transposase domain-containing protein, partial [Caballeronia sp. INML3]
LVESAKANSTDPYRYLLWLFQRLPHAMSVEEYAALLPWNSPGTCRAAQC